MSGPTPSLPRLVLRGPAVDVAAAGREWLVANGLGGYASGSVLGIPTRRYHGVFVPNLSEPKGRYVVVPRIDDWIDTEAGTLNLGGAEHGDGSLGSDALHALREFRLDGTAPVWLFDVHGSLIERRVVMPHGRNAVCVRWQLLDGPACRARLRVFAGARRQDAPLVLCEHAPYAIEPAQGGALRLRFPGRGVTARLGILPEDTPFVHAPLIDRDVLLRTERERGHDHSEHMHSPGYWAVQLAPGREAAFFASTGDDAPALAPAALFEAERERVSSLLSRARPADEVEARLATAADAFVVLPASRRDDVQAALAGDDNFRSVMAGYHWFNDWGRDTMISLEGLTLATGRHAEARAILRTFAGYIRDGLLPNLFPEGGREALYHTADATLWYFHALGRYLAISGDDALLAELYPALADVIEHHLRGTRFGIGVDARDGLVHASAEGLQLTWMDAKVDAWVVTPRRGKPVEIQALWFNALRSMGEWSRRLGVAGANHDALAERVQASFERRYWSERHGHLFDVVDAPDGDDPSLRPNQVFAMSLTHPVLAREHWQRVMASIERELLTPYGLRTLAPRAPGYRPRYAGSLRERDAAYHQGTVWPWLLGHFVDAWLRVHGPGAEARALLEALPKHLLEAGIGHVSEVFDAEPPHRPGGCIAQAWSAAELLRAWQKTRDANDG